MSNYIATVIKTGNSYALRVPKAYVEESKLKLGQKVEVGAPGMIHKQQSRQAIQEAIRKLQETGAFQAIKDPLAWQREIRKDRSLPGRS